MDISPLGALSASTYDPIIAVDASPIDDFGPTASISPMIESASFAARPSSLGSAGIGSEFESIVGMLMKQVQTLEHALTGIFRGITHGVGSFFHKIFGGHHKAPSTAANAGQFDALIGGAAKRYELDPALLRAVINQESGFQAQAVSSAGALGLMQLMPDTAKSLGVTNPLDPAQNVDGGARLLRQLIDRYGGRLDLALAAYNAGSGAVDKYGGVPPYAETQNYVSSILTAYRESALS